MYYTPYTSPETDKTRRAMKAGVVVNDGIQNFTIKALVSLRYALAVRADGRETHLKVAECRIGAL